MSAARVRAWLLRAWVTLVFGFLWVRDVTAGLELGFAALLLSAGSGHPDGLCNGSGLVGRRLMVHPFANVMGLFDEQLRTWQGHIGSKIVSYEFYETDERRDFVRGAKWSLAPTGGPINAALPTRAGGSTWAAKRSATSARSSTACSTRSSISR